MFIILLFTMRFLLQLCTNSCHYFARLSIRFAGIDDSADPSIPKGLAFEYEKSCI